MNGYIEAGYVIGIGGVGAYALGLAVRVRRLEQTLAGRRGAAPLGPPARPGRPEVP